MPLCRARVVRRAGARFLREAAAPAGLSGRTAVDGEGLALGRPDRVAVVGQERVGLVEGEVQVQERLGGDEARRLVFQLAAGCDEAESAEW